MTNILKSTLILTLICVWAAGTLAWVENSTQNKIKDNEIKKQQELKQIVLKEANSFKEIEKDIFLGYDKSGQIVGLSIGTESKGYGGVIKMLVGIGTDRKIKGFEILSHKETPGLGTGIEKESFKNQFKEKEMEKLILKKDNPNGEIDAITAATISTRAVIDGLKKALDKSDKVFEGAGVFKTDNTNKKIDKVTSATISSEETLNNRQTQGDK